MTSLSRPMQGFGFHVLSEDRAATSCRPLHSVPHPYFPMEPPHDAAHFTTNL